jgi:hypothetical protein
MKPPKLVSALALLSLSGAAVLWGCSGSQSTKGSGTGGASGGTDDSKAGDGQGGSQGGSGGSSGTPSAGTGGSGGGTSAGRGGAASCAGSAPACRGTSLESCCAPDPYARAVCRDGQWMCSFSNSDPWIAAPGCNGQTCDLQSGGAAGTAGADPGGAGSGTAFACDAVGAAGAISSDTCTGGQTFCRIEVSKAAPATATCESFTDAARQAIARPAPIAPASATRPYSSTVKQSVAAARRMTT